LGDWGGFGPTITVVGEGMETENLTVKKGKGITFIERTVRERLVKRSTGRGLRRAEGKRQMVQKEGGLPDARLGFHKKRGSEA